MDSRALDRDVAGAAAAHQLLLEALDRGEVPDPEAPSRLPGWTAGHVLTHLARNADSLIRLFDGAPAYPGGRAGRDAEIEDGAGRPIGALVEDLRRSIWRLETRWVSVASWETMVSLAGGSTVPLADLPARRWREVAVHHVDLDIGYEFADLPADFVRLELRRCEMVWASRRPMGLAALPILAFEQPPAERLAWLLGRAEIDGLDPAGVIR